MRGIGRRAVIAGAAAAMLVGLFPLGSTALARSAHRAASQSRASSGTTPATAVHDLLPDMRMAPLYSMHLETTSNGRKHLRFGTIGWNVGDGPLEARGKKVDPPDQYMQFRQRIYNSAGGFRNRVTPGVMIFETGDHHHHWHVRQFMVAQMYKPGDPNGNVYGLRKIGYCLLDARRMGNPPPHSPTHGQYPFSACGVKTSTHVTMGLSVGYGDDYPSNFAHQWMDVTGIHAGTYRICTTVDPLGEFEEKNESNNQRWTDVSINLAQNHVKVLGTGVGACGPTVATARAGQSAAPSEGNPYTAPRFAFAAESRAAAAGNLPFDCHIGAL